MKFQRFFKTIETMILKNSNVNIKTIKIIMDAFYRDLSFNEKLRYAKFYKNLQVYKNSQETLDATLENIKITQYEQQLDLLKKSIVEI